MVIVERSIDIAAPVAQVRRQFGDVAHHQHPGVHPGVTFEVISDDHDICRYRQVTRIGPLRSTQEMELRRRAEGPLVNTIVRGVFRGGAIVFDVAESGPDRTTVAARLESDRTAHRVFRPLISLMVGRALGAALDEDRHDLESGRYPAHA